MGGMGGAQNMHPARARSYTFEREGLIHRFSTRYPPAPRGPRRRRPFYSRRYLDSLWRVRRWLWWLFVAGAVVDLVARYFAG